MSNSARVLDILADDSYETYLQIDTYLEVLVFQSCIQSLGCFRDDLGDAVMRHSEKIAKTSVGVA